MTALARIHSAHVDAHIAALQAGGVGVHRIARLSGVPYSVVYRHSAGATRGAATIAVDAANRILAVPVDGRAVAPRRLVRAVGTRRRVQALVACGWSRQQLAVRLGATPTTIGTLARADVCSVHMAVAVRDLYEVLWDKQPTAATGPQRQSVSRARAEAGRRGWAPPLAWDDGTIDDPSAVPDTGVTTGRRGQADRIEDLAWLLDHDVDPAAAIIRAGFTTRSYALKVLARAGHRDLATRLTTTGVAA